MTSPGGRRAFETTHWSLVLAAASGAAGSRAAGSREAGSREAGSRAAGTDPARQALEALCRRYWYPLYAFVRFRGYSADDAQDLTQAFFTRLIETEGLAGVDPGRGRFRSYLLGAMKHFLANQRQRAQATKRGGDVVFIEWDALASEQRYALEPAETPDPDAAFDRQWAREVTARALDALQARLESRGQGELFEGLKGSLTGDEPARSETAARLGMSEDAVKVAIHRLRRRYRELLRAEIATTVADPSDVEAEMRHLVMALRSG